MRIFLLFCQRCHSSFLLITSPSVPFSRVCMRIASGTCSAGESVFHNSMLTLKQKIVDILDTNIRWWQPWEDITSDGTVEVGISCYEHVRLHHVHTVQVLTQDRGQGHLPQLLQLVWEQEITLRIQCWNNFVPMTLTFSECWWWDVVLIPEPVSLLQNLELLTQETTKCWTHHSSRQWSFSQTSHHQVNIIMVSVDRGQQVNGGVLNCVVQLFEWSNRWQSTVLSNLVKKIFLILNIFKLINIYLGICWQSMISSCLNDWSNLVNSKIWNNVESWELLKQDEVSIALKAMHLLYCSHTTSCKKWLKAGNEDMNVVWLENNLGLLRCLKVFDIWDVSVVRLMSLSVKSVRVAPSNNQHCCSSTL